MLKKNSNVETNLLNMTYTYEEAENSFLMSFSSQLYLNKFEERIDEYCDNCYKIMSSIFGCKLSDKTMRKLFAINLYRAIEKRGFLVLLNGKVYTQWQSIKLSGATVTLLNLNRMQNDSTEN